MKKTLMTLVFVLITAVIAHADTVGFINLGKVFENTPSALEFKSKFERKQKELQELFEKKTKKIDEEYKAGKPEATIKDMLKKRDEELEPKRQELMEMEMGFKQNFELLVKKNVKDIAAQYEIDMVVDQQVVYFGGFDLTDLLIERLKVVPEKQAGQATQSKQTTQTKAATQTKQTKQTTQTKKTK
jgi:Skp family chaperone for outer membrane proteins